MIIPLWIAPFDRIRDEPSAPGPNGVDIIPAYRKLYPVRSGEQLHRMRCDGEASRTPTSFVGSRAAAELSALSSGTVEAHLPRLASE